MCVKREENNMQQYEACIATTEASTEISLMWTQAKMTAADPQGKHTDRQTDTATVHGAQAKGIVGAGADMTCGSSYQSQWPVEGAGAHARMHEVLQPNSNVASGHTASLWQASAQPST